MTQRPKPAHCPVCGGPLVKMFRLVRKVHPGLRPYHSVDYVTHYICGDTTKHPLISIRVQVVSEQAQTKMVATRPRRE